MIIERFAEIMKKNTKYFGQWKIVRHGIETSPGHPYWFISIEEVSKDYSPEVEKIKKMHRINESDLISALDYGKRHFKQFAKLTRKSDREKYDRMMEEYNKILWHENGNGNHIENTSCDFCITVFKTDSNRWKYAVNDVFSANSFKSVETAKKKAFKCYFLTYCSDSNGN